MKVVLANQFKNETLRLVEWLEYYRDRGIVDFILCDDNSADDSIDKIRSVEGINCVIINSSSPPSKYESSKDAEMYRGDCGLALSISTNFKRMYEMVLDHYGKSTILGFFDVDEYLIGKTKDLSSCVRSCIDNHLLLSVCSFEVDSREFCLSANKRLTKQTTKSTSTENRFRSERKTFKSFCSLFHQRQSELFTCPASYLGQTVHACGIHVEKEFGCDGPKHPTLDSEEWYCGDWKLASPSTLKFLHYRIPSYIQPENYHLFDTEYSIP